MKVWIVFNVEQYVANRLERVFSTEEKAIAYINENQEDVRNGDYLNDYCMEQWEADKEIEESHIDFPPPFYSLSEEDQSKFFDLSHDSKRELLSKEKQNGIKTQA